MSRDKPSKKKTLAQEKASARRTSIEVNDLREKMIEIKKALPRGAVTKFISLYPEFNPYSLSSRVRLVFNLTIVDEGIIDKFKKLAELHAAEVKKGNIGIKK